MKSSAPHATVDKADAQAAGQGVAMVDNRAVAVAQRQALAAIDSSPRQVAQRQQAAAAAPPRNTTGLPDNLKAGVENLSGYSLDDVTVHYNSAKPAQLQAHAYAQGTDIHVAPGQEKHLPHEAWHVVQQKQGRVRATRQLKGGVNVNDDAGLETEADIMGAIALQNKNILAVQPALIKAHEPIAQRMTARIRKTEKRVPTAIEIADTTQAASNNSEQLKGHGRERHGKGVETPAAQQQRQAQKDITGAIEQAIQLKMQPVASPTNFYAAIQMQPKVTQRITEEDSVQAQITFTQSTFKHGYNEDMLESIIRHRYAEIQVGQQRILPIGKGADEGVDRFGRIIYNCVVVGGVHHIQAFHAHGAQEESKSSKGY